MNEHEVLLRDLSEILASAVGCAPADLAPGDRAPGTTGGRIEACQAGYVEMRSPDRSTMGEVVTVLEVPVVPEPRWNEAISQALRDPLAIIDLLDGMAPGTLILGQVLRPVPGDLRFACACASAQIGNAACGHARRLARTLLFEIRRDPWTLVTVRGGVPARFIDAAARHLELANGPAPEAVPTSEGSARMPAEQLWAGRDDRDADPAPSPSVRRSPAHRFIDPPLASGIDGNDLERLAEDARSKAQRLLELDPETLAQRIRSGRPRPPGYEVLDIVAGRVAPLKDPQRTATIRSYAARLRVDPGRLIPEVEAWIVGGREALEVTLHPWDAPEEDLITGARALGQGSRSRANRVTNSDSSYQLRFGRDGQWFGYRFDPEVGWIIDDGPAATPDRLCTTRHGKLNLDDGPRLQ